ncbi:hypothetical protein V8F44DRAFT_642151 [Aspergillus fumigatus]
METILTILCVIPGGLLGCLIYILINAKRVSGRWTCRCQHCQHRNPGQTDSNVTNRPILKTESFESGTGYLSPSPNVCQADSEAPKPPPVTDPCITASEITNAPSSTTEGSMHRISRWRPRKKRRALSSRIQGSVTSNSTAAAFSNHSAQGKQQMNIGRPRASILKSVYMTNRTSRIPRPINREGLHCRSRPKKVTFGEI